MRGLGTFRPREASQPAPCLAKPGFVAAVDRSSLRPCSEPEAGRTLVCLALAVLQVRAEGRGRAAGRPEDQRLARSARLLLPCRRPLADIEVRGKRWPAANRRLVADLVVRGGMAPASVSTEELSSGSVPAE
jgi:hypothetical protein